MNQSHKVSILLVGAVIGIVMGGTTGVGVGAGIATPRIAYGPAYPLPVPVTKVRYTSALSVYAGATVCEIVDAPMVSVVSCNNGYSGKY